MKKIKKIIVLAMATTMLLGATLNVNAAYCPHSPGTSSSTYTETSSCGHAMGCTITRTVTLYTTKCNLCGILLNTSTSAGQWSHSKPLT